MRLTAPTATGTKGAYRPPSARACRISQTATTAATQMSTRKATGWRARVPAATAPRVTPVPMARGRLRPARLTGASGAAAARAARRVGSVSATSDLGQLGFLGLDQSVDRLGVLLRQRIEVLLPAVALVLAD